MDYTFPHVVKLSDICRICLMQVDNMKYLLSEDEEVAGLITMLESVAILEFQRNDVLPAYICVSCQDKLKTAYEFQQLCLKSHETIKTIILSNADGITDLNETLKGSHFIHLTPVDISLEHNTIHTVITIPESLQDNERDLGRKCNENYSDEPVPTLIIEQSNEENSENVLISEQIDVKENNIQDEKDNGDVSEFFQKEVDNILASDEKEVEQSNENEVRRSDERNIGQSELLDNENKGIPTSKKDMGQVEVLENQKKSPTKSKKASNIKPKGSKKKPNTSKTEQKQTMRLEQFPIEKVNEAIEKINKKFLENNECLKCRFVGTNARALGLHISHIHRDIRDRWCSHCNLEFDNLAAHMKIHVLERMKCQFCSKSFQAKGHLIEHLRSHSVCRPFSCEICEKSFISSRHLRVHSRTHSREHSYECKNCNKTFMHHNGFKKHLQKFHDVKCIFKKCSFYSEAENSSSMPCPLHTQESPTSKESPESGEDELLEDLYKFAESTNSKRVTTSVLHNYCKTCNKKVRSLGLHNAKYHNSSVDEFAEEDKKNLCNVCGKLFKSTYKLRTHMRVHTGETPYKCSYCDKKLLTRSHLVVHERTHTGEKPHVCKFCGKGFAQSTVLATHMRIHTGRPIECKICHQRFCRKGELQLHLRKHTGEKPYLCNECGKAFIQRSHLVEHIKTHSNEKPFRCDYCDRGFRQHSSLKTHRSIHLGYKPFKCSECPYACRQSYSLTQHMLTHGADGAKPKKNEVCVSCDKQFITRSQLLHHKVKMHNMAEYDSY